MMNDEWEWRPRESIRYSAVRCGTVRGSVMCERIRVRCVGVDVDATTRGSERFDEMRICRVELSCGVGVACAV